MQIYEWFNNYLQNRVQFVLNLFQDYCLSFLFLLFFFCFVLFKIMLENKLKLAALREKCPYLELFWSAFSQIWTEYGQILHLLFWAFISKKQAWMLFGKIYFYRKVEVLLLLIKARTPGHDCCDIINYV